MATTGALSSNLAMNSPEIENGGLVMIASQSRGRAVRNSMPLSPKPVSRMSVEMTVCPWAARTFEIAPSPQAGFQMVLVGRDRKAPFTVRKWARLGRVDATKRRSGRGAHAEWVFAHSEYERYQRDGLLPHCQ